MNLKLNAFVIGFILVATSAAQATPQAIIKSRFSGQVAPNNTGCLFPDDAVNVSIMDNGKKLASWDFCSSYGRAKARAFTTRTGHTFALVEIGEGRGTNATTNYLTVFRVEAASLDEVLRVLISWSTGPNGRFTYDYAVGDDQSGGLEISLKGRDAAAGDECCVPPEKAQTIRIDQ